MRFLETNKKGIVRSILSIQVINEKNDQDARNCPGFGQVL